MNFVPGALDGFNGGIFSVGIHSEQKRIIQLNCVRSDDNEKFMMLMVVPPFGGDNGKLDGWQLPARCTPLWQRSRLDSMSQNYKIYLLDAAESWLSGESYERTISKIPANYQSWVRHMMDGSDAAPSDATSQPVSSKWKKETTTLYASMFVLYMISQGRAEWFDGTVVAAAVENIKSEVMRCQ
jgi:hypothetical protein